MGFFKTASIVVLLLAIVVGVFVWYIRLPGKNGLGYTTLAEEAVRSGVILEGKNIIVTGGHSGIGIPTVEVLSKYNPSIWMLARPESMKKCESLVVNFRLQSRNEKIYCEEMDLSSMKSVKKFVENWKKKGDIPVHILINNAAIGATLYEETVDGFESIWATNHLGPFLLTNLLIDNLKKGAPSRVVVVSSDAHRMTDIIWDDISGRNTWHNRTDWYRPNFYGPFVAYGQSKTANILFSLKLNEKMSGFGTSNSLHPGLIKTGILRKMNDWIFDFIHTLGYLIGKSPSQGAATQIYVATAPELEGVGGKYFRDCNEKEPEPYATDPQSADRLWKLCEEMVSKYLN